MKNYLFIAIWLPLVGFLVNGIFGSRIKNEKVIGTIASSTVFFSFLLFIYALLITLETSSENSGFIINFYEWIKVGSFSVGFSYLFDQLSITMALIVTGVGFLIHVYSIGYMHNDKGFWRFFAYLNLFIFAMLNLVMADNFVLLFLGWEGVGLCSYLLIGFWYDRKFEKSTTAEAAKKAFVVNRIGDFGFLIGMFFMYANFGSLKFNEVFPLLDQIKIGDGIITIIALSLFLGATGKSAQIPLYVWLPDAMAGPTPVSALIHAATMVTAGVYLCARASILFALSPLAMTVIAVIGLTTALFAATIGLVQTDIKKILAYSTISQLGYMFLAVGVGAFSSAIFHVMTHAFFKALLFLAAGSVIHAMHEEQNILKYGGLKKYLPATYITFLIGSLAIAGFPGFSGFFSKDEILWHAFSDGSAVFWTIGIITAALTAFYTFRMFTLTFLGKPRFDQSHIHPHESPKVMLIPLFILAFLSVVGGIVGLPEFIFGEGSNRFAAWLDPVFEKSRALLPKHQIHSHTIEIILMSIAIIISLSFMYFAYKMYLEKKELATKIAAKYKITYAVLQNKYFIDEIYEAVFVNPIVNFSRDILWKISDVKIIDGLINFMAEAVEKFSESLRKIQVGIVQIYAFLIIVAVSLGMLYLIIIYI